MGRIGIGRRPDDGRSDCQLFFFLFILNSAHVVPSSSPGCHLFFSCSSSLERLFALPSKMLPPAPKKPGLLACVGGSCLTTSFLRYYRISELFSSLLFQFLICRHSTLLEILFTSGDRMRANPFCIYQAMLVCRISTAETAVPRRFGPSCPVGTQPGGGKTLPAAVYGIAGGNQLHFF